MPQITLTLSLDQTNTILQALGQLPYAQVYELIELIGQQAAPQVQPVTNRPAGGAGSPQALREGERAGLTVARPA
ncbi:hypothetical protein ACN28C_25055 [Plantactinospora sp. WMMC1484]|uniref:hypothetical protein n=1 Tax=Plantactinospora sp. WMMC1484 TaxID=3404122 RepID=UPI003BF6059A